MRKIHLAIAVTAVIMASLIAYFALSGFAGEEPFRADAYFCPADDCFALIAGLISNSTKADCAFYTLSSFQIENALMKAESRMVSDEKCPDGVECRAKPSYRRGLMHDKFCILDDSIVITGSFNPNEKSKSYRNNVAVLRSENIAKEYSKEFEELWGGDFGGGRKGSSESVFFCPEDNCQNHLLEELEKAEESIYFLVYSFTDNEIADELLGKMGKGVIVRGFFDKSQNSKWSVYPKLEGKADVKVYDKGVLHHKVFIIDNETVITGSYNPTQNGNENNDENMLVIREGHIALSFADEFTRLYSEA
ncbi:MAG: phospholipase D-like domain-containing protein [Candidatus Nanoarchaeia archaeon]|nr:phospholipase D-like domain-containing protein [Candidatus Nanoarchaeia archaeon]